MLNNKAGTSSVLTMGFVAGHVDTVVPGWPGAFVDNNNGSGGILGISKTGINTQILTGSLHTYSGPTMINEGILQFGTAAIQAAGDAIELAQTRAVPAKGVAQHLVHRVLGVPPLDLETVVNLDMEQHLV